MDDFDGRVAVVTGGGSGIGRELVRQLAAAGSDVAMCDIDDAGMQRTAELVTEDGADVTVTRHVCDVSDETQMQGFREEASAAHDTDVVHLLVNNAGIGGGESFLLASREEWDRTMAVTWGGVYNGCRVFMPMLVAAERAAVVNISSVAGFLALRGPGQPHTAYATAKYAVRGFTEGLLVDLRTHAPHVTAHVVMPSWVRTPIISNTRRAHGGLDIAPVRAEMAAQGVDVDELTDQQVLDAVDQEVQAIMDSAVTPEAAAEQILDGLRADQWRILIGEDAVILDEGVRRDPWSAYDYDYLASLFGGIDA